MARRNAWQGEQEDLSWGERQRQRFFDRWAVAWGGVREAFTQRQGERGERGERVALWLRTRWARVLVGALLLEIAWLVLLWR